ncbi:hypothetical protein ACFQ0G_22875 [Streptomyces chiangmaiensis]
MNDRIEPSARELSYLLAAVLEAIAIPHPATVGDSEVHDRILLDRVMDARIALEGVLQQGDDPGWAADYLRARLAENPATGYRTEGGPVSTREPLYGAAADRVRDRLRDVDTAVRVLAAVMPDAIRAGLQRSCPTGTRRSWRIR